MTMAGARGEAACGAATPPHAVPVAAHGLRRQASMPAALASALIAPCGGGFASRATVVCWDDGSGDAGLRVRGRAPRQLVPAGGAGSAVRALWAWVARRGRKAVVMSRSGSSSGRTAKEQQQPQYGHEEYAQNFDEGGAAREPDNLSRSFSARYASARPAPWGAARR